MLPFKKLHTSPEKKVGSFCGVHLLSFKKQSFQRPKKLSPALHGHAMQCQMYCFFVLDEGALFRSRTSNSSLAGSQLELHVLGKSLYHCVDLWVRLCANDSRLRELCSHQKSRAQGERLTLSTKQGWDPDRPTLCGDCGTGTLPGEPNWTPSDFLLSLLIKCRKAQSCTKCAAKTLMPWGQQAKNISQSFNFSFV